MAAVIRSLQNGITPIIGASRDDLVVGDVVTVNANTLATTYAWTIAFKPEGSAAVFSGDPLQNSPGNFTIDLEGPYLIGLVVDAGLATESYQYVRLRALTAFADLKLVAAGERRDVTGTIPVDVDLEGWANEQNFNLQTIKGFVKSVAASGQILYADPNASTEGYGDYPLVQSAIDAAVAAVATLASPYIVACRPGVYTENLTFAPHVHVLGWPGNSAAERDHQVVVLRGLHTITHTAVGDSTLLANLSLENVGTTTTALLSKLGAGKAVLYRCQLEQRGVSVTQGVTLDLQAGSFYAQGCRIRQLATADDRVAFLQSGASTSSYFWDTHFNGPSAVDINPGLGASVTCSMRDSEAFSTGAGASWGVRCSPQTLDMDYCQIRVNTGDPLLIHPTGGANPGAVAVALRWSLVEGDINFDVTGIVGATSLSVGSCEYTDLVFPGGAVTTLAATTMGTSLFYDNTTTGMTAENVQDAIDEVHVLAVLVTTLDDAYDGGLPGTGTGRTIYADQGAMQILDANPPSSPPPAGNTDGVLQVVSSVELGAIGVPEINLDPNPYGSGPYIVLGQMVVPTDMPFGAGTAAIMANSTGTPLFRNYNFRVQTKSSDGGTAIGRLILRGGDGYSNNPATPDGSSVYVQAGNCDDAAMGAAGDIFLSPGYGAFGSLSGSLWIVDPALSTQATLTAAGVFVGGVAGDITFGTNMGAVTASILVADNVAAVLVKLNALDGLTAAGNPIVISTTALGPNAEIYELDSDAGVSVALGGFTVAGGAAFVAGTYAAAVDLQCTAAGVLEIGPSGAAGPLIYDAATGKLTVPGLIDPTGLIFEEAGPPATGATEGAIFVSDGTAGLVQNNLYYRYAASGVNLDLTVGAINNTLDGAYDQGGAGLGRTIIADAGAVQILDANPPSNPLPAGNADGVLQVVSSVEIGAIGFPEIDLDPNPYGSGPYIVMGQTDVATDMPFGAGTAVLMANSTGNPLYRNYNFRVQTKSTDGGGVLGRLIIRGGDAYENNPTTPDASSVYIQAGNCDDAAMGVAGDIYLSPGFGAFGPTSGALWVVNPALSTQATLTAAGVFVGGVTGRITFGTNMGAVSAAILAADNLAAVLVKLNVLEGITAAGDPIVITTTALGPNAEIYELGSDAGVSVALGDFTVAGGAGFVAGTYAAAVDIQCTAAGVLEIGPSGAAGPLVYNAATGKLTVPGLIDPTGLIFEEAGPPATGATEGAIFVSDGTAGLVQNNLYYRVASSGVNLDLSTGAMNNTLDGAYDEGGAGAGRTITADAGAVVVNNAVADATNTLELTRTVGTGGALAIGPGAAVIFGDGDVVFGAAVMSGTEKMRVVGDARIEGALTTTGLLNSGGVVVAQVAAPATTATQAAFFASDGSGTEVAGEVYLRKASSATPLRITSGNDAAGYLMPYHINMPEVPNDTVSYNGWCPTGCVLTAVRVCMEVLNTQGTYTLAVTNESVGPGNTCLSAATYNMNGLVAAAVTDMTLTGTAADLVFAASDRWVITLTSNNVAFNGEAIYVEMVFKVV